MRLIDADELMEHVWRDKLDSRELIAQMIENAPTVKDIPTIIPLNVFEKLISQEPKPGHWIHRKKWDKYVCSKCSFEQDKVSKFCPNCGAFLAYKATLNLKDVMDEHENKLKDIKRCNND